jgi:diguanylate cyclase (GGDEF)-like protein
MWFEGLVAILGLNFCLLLDFEIVRDARWLMVVRNTASLTPFALAVNFLVRKNPVGWLREGSVAAAMIGICLLNLAIQGNSTTISTLFGSICVVITALFVGVVMRLRLPYMVTSIFAMLCASLWFLGNARSMRLSEIVVADSLMAIGLGIIAVAGYSLEREERRNFLLSLQRDMQAEQLALTNQALHRLSNVDTLTGLPNRRAFEDRLTELWIACAVAGESLAAVVVDVDHFKVINDTHGHLFGDETLRRIGALLPQSLRSREDMAVRFGGEEFVLLLAHADQTAAITVAERARQIVENAGTPVHSAGTHGSAIWVTVSCGVSSCVPNAAMHWTDLIASADEALYAAKRAGRNRVEFRACRSVLPGGMDPADAPSAGELQEALFPATSSGNR